MTLAPISTAGSVQTTALARRSTGGDAEQLVQQTGTLVLDSYVLEPWLARVGGELSLAFEQDFGDEPGSSLQGSGSATLAVLPQSKYPVTVNLAHLDSRVSGEFSGSDFTLDRGSLTARAAITDNFRGGLVASWDRTDRDDSGVLNSRNVSLDLNKSFTEDEAFLGLRGVGFGATLRKSDFTADNPEDDDRDRTNVAFTLSTRSEPAEKLHYDSLLTASYDDALDGDESFERLALQGISTLQWRPENHPFVVTGTLRTLTEQITEIEDGNTSDSDTTLASGTLGLRWPINDRLSFNAGLRGSYQDISRDSGAPLGETGLSDGVGVSATALAGVSYVSEARPIGRYEWRWNANAQTENGVMEDEGAISRETFSIGHRFERTLDRLISVPLRFSVDQDVDVSVDTTDDDDPYSVGFSNSVSFDYSTADQSSSRFARLFLRDSRNIVGERREFQTVQGRYGHRIAFDRDRRLQANATGQFLRNVTDDDDDFFISLSGNIAYEHRNLFDVENLSFRSELRLNLIEIESLFIDPEDEIENELARNDWRNILSYRIGRLTAELEGTLFQRDEDPGYLLLFRIRRDFGGGD